MCVDTVNKVGGDSPTLTYANVVKLMVVCGAEMSTTGESFKE